MLNKAKDWFKWVGNWIWYYIRLPFYKLRTFLYNLMHKEVKKITQNEETIGKTKIESFPQNNVAKPTEGNLNAKKNAADIKTNSEKIAVIQTELKSLCPDIVNFKQRVIRFLDWNDDGKLDIKDVGRFFEDLLLILLGALTVVTATMYDKIMDWINSGSPNYTVIMGTIVSVFIAAVGALIRRKWAQASQTNEQKIGLLTTMVQTGKNLIQQMDLQHQTDLYAKDLDYLNQIKAIENNAAQLQGQLQLANDMKKQFAEMLQLQNQ